MLPAPQSASQTPQSDQDPTSALLSPHGSLLQPRISPKCTAHRAPPWDWACTTARCRACCPPPHVASHSSHAVQSDTTQSTTALQGWVSFVGPAHCVPESSASCSTFLCRDCIWLPSHLLHSDQAPSSQGLALWMQGSVAHGSSCSRGPLQGSPPDWEAFSMERALLRRPPSQVRVHSDQDTHSDSLQSTAAGGGTMQDTVSLMDPTHGFPSSLGACRISRVRNLCCPVLEHLGGTQALQLDITQSSFWSHVFPQFLVSRREPLHGLPPQLSIFWMTRWRSQSCKQVGSVHSFQSLKTQSCGSHLGAQST
mmetsp:Transcript_57066/g.158824  ORF Transcript_57066/g.158824 Transcript_57066/m.158824 type:complete len:310 (+) Transcript_57066:1600-2529(+)